MQIFCVWLQKTYLQWLRGTHNLPGSGVVLVWAWTVMSWLAAIKRQMIQVLQRVVVMVTIFSRILWRQVSRYLIWGGTEGIVVRVAIRPRSDLRFWNSTHLKLFQLTFQLSWNLFFELTSEFCDSLFDLGLYGTIVISYSKRKQVRAISIMTPSQKDSNLKAKARTKD